MHLDRPPAIVSFGGYLLDACGYCVIYPSPGDFKQAGLNRFHRSSGGRRLLAKCRKSY
jgi:hypothetical protein